MKLTGTIEIAADARDVWTVIIDPMGLSACVPGVSNVRQVDERTFEGSVSAAVGPIDGHFDFRSVIVRADFPDDLSVQVEGVDSVTRSRLIADVTAGLVEGSPTTLRYQAVVTVKGRLAILGEMVLRASAGMMIGQVTRCIQSRLEMIDPNRPAADRAVPGI